MVRNVNGEMLEIKVCIVCIEAKTDVDFVMGIKWHDYCT